MRQYKVIFTYKSKQNKENCHPILQSTIFFVSEILNSSDRQYQNCQRVNWDEYNMNNFLGKNIILGKFSAFLFHFTIYINYFMFFYKT